MTTLGSGLTPPSVAARAMPPPQRTALQEPSPEAIVPDEVMARLNEPFTQHDLYKGMSALQVREAILHRATADQDELNALIKQGYGPTKKTKRGRRQKGREGGTMEVGTAEKGLFGEAPAKPTRRAAPRMFDDQKQRAVDLLADWARHGDLATDSAHDLATKRAAWEKGVDIDPDGPNRRTPLALDLLDALINRLPRHLLIADPGTSWGYTGRNIIGNAELSAIGTQGESLLRLKDAFQGVRADDNPISAQIRGDLGFGGRSNEQFLQEGPTQYDRLGPGVDTPTRELARKLRLDAIPRAFDWKRRFDAGFERSMKLGGSYAPMVQRFVTERIADLADASAAYAERRGIRATVPELEDLFWALRKPGTGVFAANDVYDAVFRLGKDKGLQDGVARKWAERSSRDWANLAWDADQQAIRETNRMFPSRRGMTQADQYASYIALFHFWPTRSARFVLEEMIRHPQLALAWARAHQGMERLAEEGGYPAAVRGFLRISEGPFGFALYANPVSLFLVTALNPEQAGVPDPRNVTALGEALLDFRKKTGLGPAPMIDAVLNIAGVYGDALPPNPWPSRTTELAGAVIDEILVEMGMGFGNPVYDRTMEWLREAGSGYLPGTEKIEAGDARGYTNDLVGSMVLDQNPDLMARMNTPAGQKEFAAIMAAEREDPRYLAAEKAVARTNLTTRAMQAFNPITVRPVLETRSRTLEVRDAGKGSSYDDRTPEQQLAGDIRASVVRSPAAVTAGATADEYRELGDERAQALASGWNEIVYGHDGQLVSVDIGGRLYTIRELRAMGEDGRKKLADQWVKSEGGTKELETQRATQKGFKEADADYAAFAEWRTQMYDYAEAHTTPDTRPTSRTYTPIAAAREALMRRSPSYEAYILALPAAIRNNPKKLDNASVSTDAYLAQLGEKTSIYAGDTPPSFDPTAVPGSTGMFPPDAAAGSGGGTKTPKEPSLNATRPRGMPWDVARRLARVVPREGG